MIFDTVAFDADDTLWHTECLYRRGQEALSELLAPLVDAETLAQRLYRTEIANLTIYGYGVKSFALSMIETAIALSEDEIGGREVAHIIQIAREMLTSEVRLLDHVEHTLDELTADHQLMVVTKGDASEQIPKLVRSGIADHFQRVEVVGEKTTATYARILRKYAIAPERFLMAGNSLKSDVLPVLELGGYGVYIPSEVLWAHEQVDETPIGHPRYFELTHIAELPTLIQKLRASR